MRFATKNRKTPAGSGFTLIELLAVVFVGVLLLSLLVTGIQRLSGISKRSSCQNNLRQLAGAVLLRAADHNGALPHRARTETDPNGSGQQWPRQLAPYLGIEWSDFSRPTVLHCPGSLHYLPEEPGRSLGYRFNRHITQANRTARGELLDVRTSNLDRLATIENPSKLLILLDAELHAGPRNTSLIRNGGSNNSLDMRSFDANLISFLPYSRHGGVVNVAFLDGHVEALPPDENGLPEGAQWTVP